MADQPHLTHGLERAQLLLGLNRLSELTFDDLTPPERSLVLNQLEAKMARTRRRAIRSHVTGIASTIAFIALAAFLFVLGPLAHIGPAGQVEMSDATLEAQVWVIAIVLTALGIATADYMLRRRRTLTRLWDHESAAIADTIARAAAHRTRETG